MERRCCFSMIRFVRLGCRCTKSWRRNTKCSRRFIRDSPERKMISINSRKWKICSFIISIFALGIDRAALAGASFGGWVAAEWAIRYSDQLRSLILIDALGLRLNGAPAADVLSLDGPAMRQVIFGDPASALAVETLPDTPKADDMVSTILARRTLARFAW